MWICERASGFTGKGTRQTNYSSWTTNFVYWSTALKEPLQSTYLEMRALRFVSTPMCGSGHVP